MQIAALWTSHEHNSQPEVGTRHRSIMSFLRTQWRPSYFYHVYRRFWSLLNACLVKIAISSRVPNTPSGKSTIVSIASCRGTYPRCGALGLWLGEQVSVLALNILYRRPATMSHKLWKPAYFKCNTTSMSCNLFKNMSYRTSLHTNYMTLTLYYIWNTRVFIICVT